MIVTLSFYKYSKYCFTFMLLCNIAWKWQQINKNKVNTVKGSNQEDQMCAR